MRVAGGTPSRAALARRAPRALAVALAVAAGLVALPAQAQDAGTRPDAGAGDAPSASRASEPARDPDAPAGTVTSETVTRETITRETITPDDGSGETVTRETVTRETITRETRRRSAAVAGAREPSGATRERAAGTARPATGSSTDAAGPSAASRAASPDAPDGATAAPDEAADAALADAGTGEPADATAAADAAESPDATPAAGSAEDADATAAAGAAANPDATAADDTDAVADTAGAPTPVPPNRPYSIPWNLRPLPAVNLVRLDQSLGIHDAYGPSASGTSATFAQLLTVGWRVTDYLMLIARWGWDTTSGPGDAGTSALLLGANFAARIEEVFRLSVFVAMTAPTGGLNGQPSHRDARLVRASMDNAMFLPGHFAGIVGIGVAWVDQGWTVHAEASLFTLGRLSAATDDAIVNATFGAHVGYFVVPQLSVSGELHHQHFLSDPVALTRTPPMDYGEELRSQTSGTLGVRAHANLGGSVWLRPGLAWTIGFDAPMAGDEWQIIQLDLPLIF